MSLLINAFCTNCCLVHKILHQCFLLVIKMVGCALLNLLLLLFGHALNNFYSEQPVIIIITKVKLKVYISETTSESDGFVGCISRVQFEDLFPLKGLFTDPPQANVKVEVMKKFEKTPATFIIEGIEPTFINWSLLNSRILIQYLLHYTSTSMCDVPCQVFSDRWKMSHNTRPHKIWISINEVALLEKRTFKDGEFWALWQL